MSTRHVALHKMEFPNQTGGQREDKLTDEMDAAFELAFRVTSIPPTDDPDCIPDGGGGCLEIEHKPNFHLKWHTWNYQPNNTNYEPRGEGVGDYLFVVFDRSPPGNWWQEFN